VPWRAQATHLPWRKPPPQSHDGATASWRHGSRTNGIRARHLPEDMAQRDENPFEESKMVRGAAIKQPALTCRSWLVSDASTGKPLLWHQPTVHLQPASITKVVTAMVVLDYVDAQAKAAAKGPKVPKSSKGTTRRSKKAALLEMRCQVSDFGASFSAWVPNFGWNQGTNAQLKAKEVYSVRELLYAMMLPSGNDAAVTLARYFGPLVSRKCPTADMGVDAEDEEEFERASIALFVEQMNKTAVALGCCDTCFKSCHGTPATIPSTPASYQPSYPRYQPVYPCYHACYP
jgi:D-alanyl-D-alanine carboxypeptidase